MTQSLLYLIRLGLDTTTTTDENCQKLFSFSIEQWRDLMSFAERQGVLAIVVDGLQVLMESHKGEIVAVKEKPAEWQKWLLERIGLLTQYEMRNHQQKKVIAELANIWSAEGIRMMVFKGQANASLYPKPEHRVVGDIDCWLFDHAKKGDEIAKVHGADVSFDWYRHSKIFYKGETIENHRVMSHTRGSKRKKAMEEEFKAMLKNSDLKTIEGCGNALMPSVLFNAYFLTYHGLHHFLSEGLRMKQILDWAMFLKVYQKEVDWETYNDFCIRYKLDKFAAVMNYIAAEFIGVALDSKGVLVDATYSEKVLNSTLYDDDYLFNSGKSDWNVRWLLVKNMLGRDRWKYENIAQESVLKHLWGNAKGFLMKEDE